MYDKSKLREQLLKRTQENYDRRDGGVSYRYFKLDKDLPLWTPKETKDKPHIVDILPFMAGDCYPILDKRNPVKKGDFVYLLEVWVHQNVGPLKEKLVCPTKNYGQPCPICEDIADMARREIEYEDYKDIVPKRRCVYNVLVYDGKNDDKVQIWEASHKYSEKPIQLQAKSPRTGGIEPFADPDIGKSISFEVANDEYKTVQGHKLLPRDYTIPDEILSKVYILDEEIVILTYEEIKKIYFGNISDEDGQKPVEQRRTESLRPEETEQKKIVEGCPHGGMFGESIDQLDTCGECKVYDKCAFENDVISARRKAERDAKRTQSTTATSTASTGRRLRRP